MSETISVEDLVAYTTTLEAELADLEVTLEEVARENTSLRRKLAGVRAVATRRKTAIVSRDLSIEQIETENTALRRRVAAYKAQSTRRRNLAANA